MVKYGIELNWTEASFEQNNRTEAEVKGTNPALKKPSNIPEIFAKMFGRFH